MRQLHLIRPSAAALCNRYVDALEKQLADAQLRNRDLLRGQHSTFSSPGAHHRARVAPDDSKALANERSQKEAALQGQRALQEEIMRMQDERENLENEALAFKERMETAVGSFEGILEQAVQEKNLAYQELLVVQGQLETAQRRAEVEAEERWRGRMEEARTLHGREISALRLSLQQPPAQGGQLDLKSKENEALRAEHDRTAQRLAEVEATLGKRIETLEMELTQERRTVIEAREGMAAAMEAAGVAREATATARDEAAAAQEETRAALRAAREAAEGAQAQAETLRGEQTAALSLQLAALEAELAAERKALAAAKEVAAAAKEEVGLARAEEKAASVKMTEMEARLAAAPQAWRGLAHAQRPRFCSALWDAIAGPLPRASRLASGGGHIDFLLCAR